LEIVLKSIIAGALVGGILYYSEGQRSDIAGILVLFPIITYISYYYIGSTQGAGPLSDLVKVSISAIPVWILSTVALAVALHYTNNVWLSLSVGMISWLILALLLLWIIN
jgi:uncharacterized membrane protein (GlpM family)